MNDNVKKLVDALRSGKYKQCRDVLRQGKNFCCLGVACDIYRKETGNGRWIKNDDDTYNFDDGYMQEKAQLPIAVSEWFDIHTSNGSLNNTIHSAMNMNDDGRTFEEIADAIEEFGFV